MCLILRNKEERTPKIATEDIVCYKFLVGEEFYTLIPGNHNGKKFRGVISGKQTEGVIVRFDDRWFFCTNDCEGRPIPDEIMPEGYEYSWVMDENISSIEVDGKEIFEMRTVLQTPYMEVEVEIGQTCESDLVVEDCNEIEIGLHSFRYEFHALSVADNFSDSIVVKCVIPKGATYYEGIFNRYLSYASDKITYVEIINN